MRKIQNVFVMFLLLASVLAIPMTLAEEDNGDLLISESLEEEQVPSAFRFGWEQFKLNFVRNQTIKAERELQLARWKIAEARVATKNGDISRAERAMEAHEQILQRVQERVSKMDNKSLTPGLDNAIQVHEQRMSNLNVALQNANLSEEQRIRVEAQIGKMNNVTGVLEQNREMIQNRIQSMVGSEGNGSEVQEENSGAQSNNSQQSGKN